MASESKAVLFALDDYASIPRRLIAFLIDIVVVILLSWIPFYTTVAMVVPKDVQTMERSPEQQRLVNKHIKPVQVPLTLGMFGMAVAYHVFARKLRGGTIGYRLARIRLVDQAGDPPRLKVLFRRFLIALPSCCLLGAGYLICAQDPKRQAIHDQWSGTWVVKARAIPVGPAEVEFKPKLVGPFMLTYVDLVSPGEKKTQEP